MYTFENKTNTRGMESNMTGRASAFRYANEFQRPTATRKPYGLLGLLKLDHLGQNDSMTAKLIRNRDELLGC